MSDIFIRTLSQGLQAFMPIAVCLAWASRNSRADLVSAIRWGMVAAVPATPAAGYLFQQSLLQAQWEAVLAAAAVAVALSFGLSVWRGTPARSAPRAGRNSAAWKLLFAAAAVLIVVRQTMEIDLVFIAAVFELRSFEATQAICGGTILALALAWAWTAFSRELPADAFARATSTFTGLFLAQALMYTLHESSEAQLLPWSEVLHTATEPYGPDGLYGPYVSYLLVILPIAAAGATLLQTRLQRRAVSAGKWSLGGWRAALATVGILGIVGLVLTRADRDSRLVPGEPEPVAVAANIATIAERPHLMFRHTGVDSHYNMLTMASLDPPGAGRTSVALGCERISFSAGNGLCLQAERAVFTTFKAVVFDRDLQVRTSFKLDGSPSRTRISTDGRVGAITVFVTGQAHGYTGSEFSTKTSLVDMASGDELGELEQFATWRNGTRFQAVDFNFWGVTFARDSNTFYATLKTAGKTYLVRGDLGLRKLTVLHENVECPSISPNNRLIAFKKRVGDNLSPWRLYLLDLATMTERALAGETRSVDDQIEWLDDSHVLYAMPRSSPSAITDIWVSPIDGDAPARVFLQEAESPVAIHQGP
jgi:hypothetical protein